MSTAQLFQYSLVWGLVFGAVFCAATLIIGRVNVAMLSSSYPPDIRAKFGAMSPETKRQAQRATLLLVGALGVVVVLALIGLRQINGVLTFGETFLAVALMFQLWNLMDLLLLDCFILLTLRPSFMVLPGTEGMAGYRDYRFHFRQFLRGTVLTLLLGLVVTVLAWGLEALL